MYIHLYLTRVTVNTCVGVYRNDECVEGGESIIVDALAVAEKFRVTHPHHFSTLVRVPATFHCIHYDRYTVYIHIHIQCKDINRGT